MFLNLAKNKNYSSIDLEKSHQLNHRTNHSNDLAPWNKRWILNTKNRLKKTKKYPTKDDPHPTFFKTTYKTNSNINVKNYKNKTKNSKNNYHKNNKNDYKTKNSVVQFKKSS